MEDTNGVRSALVGWVDEDTNGVRSALVGWVDGGHQWGKICTGGTSWGAEFLYCWVREFFVSISGEIVWENQG